MSHSLYGRSYWLGALGVVMALSALALVTAKLSGASAEWEDNIGITIGLFMWPTLVVYHMAWRIWHRAKSK